MKKIEQIEKKFSLLQKELRDGMRDMMQDYGEEKMPLDVKQSVRIWYYDDYSGEYRKGTLCAVIYRDETLLLEVENEYGETRQLDEKLGDLAFDVSEWMIAVYRKMQEQTK
ncbi:MAG: hypothetical protein LBP72_01295 [Dysgonamonadaceae bacterium]|nr:hypothetical protein [Dysgonamonadaceae bacterium]